MRSTMWGAALAALVLGMTSVPTGALAAAGGVPECTNAELVASYHGAGAAMSHRYGRIVLANTSDRSCSIRGYGGLSYVGHGDGTQIGAAADRDPSRVRTVVVAPGEKVVSRVSAAVAGAYPRHRCRPAHVNGFRVYLPDETRSQFVKHSTTGCRNHRVHLLSHKAYRRA
ncbi:MAG TPA: DUF4232 domain-containing protein [Nocardioides sp.]|nr:DUF4232 domain-containing protein [Nocardioides sp.]